MFKSSSESIESLRRRFIWVATVAAGALIGLVLLSINLANYGRSYSNSLNTLRIIADNGGTLPSAEELARMQGAGSGEKDGAGSRATRDDDLPAGIDAFSSLMGNPLATRDAADQIRYFSVMFDGEGEARIIDVSNVTTIDGDEAVSMARSLLSASAGSHVMHYDGFDYAFLVRKDGGRQLVVVLNCTNEMQTMRLLNLYSAILGMAFTVLFFPVVTKLSRRVTQPYIKNLDSQRQFVTNASHELKTPVAVIQANTELLEMMGGANEETEAIKRQTSRLTNLINRLVALSRLQETGTSKLEQVNLSQTVESVLDSYRVVVEQEGKVLKVQVQPDLEVKAEPRALRELLNILVDNANKYCDQGGCVSVTLERAKGTRRARLLVSNDYASGEGKDFSRFFERFYRDDPSHNSNISGSGIGLSMADQIVSNFRGKIRVGWRAGVITFEVLM